MNAFEMGKVAAYNDLVDLWANDCSTGEAMEEISDTLNAPLDKRASQEDVDYKLGVEAMCHEFMKEAGEVYGTYDTEGTYDDDVFEFILDKIAEKTEQQKRIQKFLDAGKEYPSLGDRPKTGGGGPRGETAQSRDRSGRASTPDTTGHGNPTGSMGPAGNADFSGAHETFQGAYGSRTQRAKKKGKEMAAKGKKHLMALSSKLPGTGKQQAAAAGLGAAALGAGGAYAAHRRKKKKKKEQEKKSFYNVDPDVYEALEVLEDAGFQIDLD